MEQALWFFDIISPFAYLHLHKMRPLLGQVKVEPVPVLFAGMLKHWDNKGPAEVPPKRLHTYQQCVWSASQAGVPFLMPPRHPFNPLAAQRLLVGLGAGMDQIEQAFHFVFGEGRDPELEFQAFAERLGVPDPAPLITAPAVKQQLMDNTQRAIDQGVFGVPTLKLRDRLFWGSDTVDWALAFLQDPDLFNRPEYQLAARSDFGITRR